MFKPNKNEVAAAANKFVPDVIAKDLHVLFCGINPSLYSAATGHHFARPGNRFWRALYLSRFTERLFSPFEDAELIHRGIGITNVVARATTAAAEVSSPEFIEGGRLLKLKVERFTPACVAVLGIGAYRTAFAQQKAVLGLQPEPLGAAKVWVLPNPSGLNANYQINDLVKLFSELRQAINESC